MTDPEERDIVKFLETRAFDVPVERIDTAGAHVFLAGDRAYKIKRPVKYSFLDFSTMEARRAALMRELELNRRTAPDLYERVVPVTSGEAGFAIDGRGEVVDWLLIMKRFPDDCLLADLAAQGKLERPLLQALADAIIELHEQTEPIRDVGAEAFRAVIDGNGVDLSNSVPAIFDEDAVRTLIQRTSAMFEERRAMLDARAEAGMVRHCHGDLHAANIVVIEGRPVLFDCVEFDDSIAQIDLLYDLAYLVMDLIERDQVAAAQFVLNAYNDRLPQDAALALMPLFLSVRAAIRAKLHGFEGRGERASRYLDLARAVLDEPPPRLFAIGGRSGTGKSTLALALAPSLGAMPGAVVLRSDVIRKRLFGVELTERLGEEAYAPEVSAEVYAIMAARAAVLLGAGRTVIADAVFGSVEERRQIEAVEERGGVPFQAVWLTADEPALEQRVRARKGDASDADVEIVRRQRAMDQSAVRWPTVATDQAFDDTLSKVRVGLRLKRAAG